MRFAMWYDVMKQLAYKDALYIDLPKGKVHYTDAGQGPVILHSHGSPSGADVGPIFLKHLVNKGYRVLTPSRPGFLGTDLSMGPSIEDQADFFKDFLDGMGIEKAFIHAWSAGGPPAIAFAHKYPERCQGLILYCAVSHTWVHKITRFEKMIMSDKGIWCLYSLGSIFKESMRKKSAQELGCDYDYIKRDPEAIALLDKFLTMTAPPALRNPGSFNDIDNYSKMGDLPLEEIRVPTLVVFSPSDNQLPVTNGDLPAEKIPGADYLRFTHGGHMPMIDKEAGLVEATVLDFLEKHHGSN